MAQVAHHRFSPYQALLYAVGDAERAGTEEMSLPTTMNA